MSGSKFTLKADGIYVGVGDNDSPPGVRISSRIEITALVRDGDSVSWGKLVVWEDADGKRHEWAMPMSVLQRDGSEAIMVLVNRGLTIINSKQLLEYLRDATSSVRVRNIRRTGWHEESGNWCFVFPDSTVGETGSRVTYAAEPTDADYGSSGNLGEWQQEVAALCSGNSRLVLSVSAAFAAMLLRFTGAENGGIHLFGPSSSGKTTAARVAASVFGSEKFIQRWRATDNGLEGIAERHNDALLVLDELAQADPRRIGDVAYMLANGQGKVRASRFGDSKPRKAWRLLFISTGETTLGQHMSSVGTLVRAGQEVRFVDLPADAGKGLGVFEALHEAPSASAFAEQLSKAASQYYGIASREFAAKCIEEAGALKDTVTPQINDAVIDFLAATGLAPQEAGGQMLRVANRFALIAAAGELATSFQITGWRLGEATDAAKACMLDWLEARGSAENSEPQAIIQAVQGFLTRHSDSRFPDVNAHVEDEMSGKRPRATYNRAGWRLSSEGATEYLIDHDVFKREVCRGFDPGHVCRVLAEHHCLRHNVEAGKNRYSLYRTTPEGKRRFYIVTNEIWEV
jgi:putative DNA primase/helicase